MRIEKLIVRKTKPDIEIIRDIPFNIKGLSLIVDNTSDLSSESGNNVGKTTAIKVIDLCLGAKSVRELYYDPDTKTENKVIKEFLSTYKVQGEIILTSNKNKISVTRDLFPRGKCYINNIPKEKIEDFWEELKKIIFKLDEPFPTFRQLIQKFVRVSNTSESSMIKYLHSMTPTATYDTIYGFLFGFLGKELASEKNDLSDQLNECKRTIRVLEKNENVQSIGVLKQKLELVDKELNKYLYKRDQLSYLDSYKEELEKKRNINVTLADVEERMQLLKFDIETINESIQRLSDDQSNVDLSILKEIYDESQIYLPQLNKKFEDVLNFHNQMIQNRIDFIVECRFQKEKEYESLSGKMNLLLEEKKKITIDILDEGLLDELNSLNYKIEDLSEQKGEITQSIKLLAEQERIRTELQNQIEEITEQIDDNNVEDNLKLFNKFFSEYCEKLYGEKYLLAYNSNWEAEKKFPIAVASMEGNVGAGKKKAIIVAFDLAYLKFAEEKCIPGPQFIVHDKLENTHINQLKSIIEICQEIDGQYIFPILRERIDKVETSYIDVSKVLELSEEEKFFKV